MLITCFITGTFTAIANWRTTSTSAKAVVSGNHHCTSTTRCCILLGDRATETSHRLSWTAHYARIGSCLHDPTFDVAELHRLLARSCLTPALANWQLKPPRMHSGMRLFWGRQT